MIKKLLYDFKLVILLMLCSIAKAQTTPISYSASPSFSNVVSGQSFTFSNISTCQTSVTLDVSNYWWTIGNNYPACNLNYRFKILVNNVEIGNNYCDGTFDLSSYIPVNSVQIVPYHSGAGNGNGSAKMDVVLTVNSPTASMPPLATTSDVFYCYSATASPLSPTLVGSGASFKWYTVATGGLPSTTAPTPNTNISNTSSYWVSQVTASGCEGERKEIQVTVNPAIVTSVGNQVNVLCHGSTTGSATVNVTGGTGTYTYSWNTTPVQTTATATGLAAGTYTVTVTDATLCFKTQSFTITEPSVLTASAGTQVNVLCRGNATGTATVNVTGGNGAYSYSWNTTPVQTTATATGLAAGNYTVTVTDANLCTTTQGFTITQPTAALVATAGTQVDVLCNSNATGEATVTATGGTGAYTYSWNTTPVQTTATATALAAGTYIATVTDANLCTATQSFTITEPAVLTATAGTQVDVLCNGNATGEATVNVTGGTGTYTYSWDTTPVQTTATASNLSAGTYIATVTDANNCTATQSFTITEPIVLTASAGTQVNVLCHGNATGEATVTATGGTGAYTYSWNTTPVQTTATAAGLAAGTYIATVTDANNCTATQSFTITEPATALTASAGTQVDVLCHGNATGEATVTATGGTGSYSYSWNTTPVQTTATASNLTAGNYTATVTDANGCTATQSFTITEPVSALALTPNTTQTDILCNGQATGSATVAVTGGTGSYTYLWSNGATTNTITGLLAGTYTVDVTDANGCVLSNSFTITEPIALTATVDSQTNVLCYGDTTGSATVAVTGGTGAYTYSWDTTPVQTTATATNLSAGTYTVTVTDANGCTTTQSFVITQPAQPLALTPNTTQTNVLCNGQATGSATVSVTGGTGAYTYLWSNGATTNTVTGLIAGTYTVDVTDANGCVLSNSFTITEPALALTATADTQTNVLCYGNATGSATVAVTGGTGVYNYSWDTTPVQTTATATNLSAGTYTVTVTDANSCATTQSFVITEPAQPLALTPNTTQTNVLCNGQATGSATIAVNGGTGAYTYLWSNGATTSTITGLVAGTYSVDVTDANGCVLSNSFTITEPTALVATASAQTNVLCYGNATGEATVAVTGGTGAYNYSWDTTPAQTTATATGLVAGTYIVTVTDANQCVTTQSFTISQPSQPLVTTPNTTQTNVSCFGGSNGTATIAVNGGTAPYTYLWSNAATTNTVTGLTAGVYSVDVTDANGCTLSQSFTITEPTLLLASQGTITNVSCFGAANGSATVTVTGGTGTYTYSWNTTPVQTTATATALAPGNYTVTVTDANQCQATQMFTITEPQQLTVAINNYTDILCYGAATGSASATVSGGTQPYTYLWNTGQTTAVANNLTAGAYTLVVTDANGCQTNASITLTQPASPLQLTTSQVNVDCASDSDGSITINATGGTGPYTYTWSPAVSTTNVAENLAVGNYNVVVTDANGCWDIRYLTITAPTAVTGYFIVTNADCYTIGSAVLHASGGVAPYTYLWSNGNTTANLENVLPGTYTVTITDTNGCTYTLSTTIYGTAPIIVTSAPQSVTVDGGATVVFTVQAQNVMYYQWQLSTDGGQTFSNLNAGGSTPGYSGVATPTLTITNAYQSMDGYKYRVILMQQNGCYILSEAATLNVNPLPPVVGVDDIKHLEMNIYPNPASTEVLVEIPNLDLFQNVKLDLYDLNGRLIKWDNHIKSDEYRLDVSGLESGVYIISITADNYKTDKKLIVNKKF